MFANFDWIGAMRSSPVMIIILGCSVITLGYALERLLGAGALDVTLPRRLGSAGRGSGES